MSETFRSAPSEQWSGHNGYKGTYAENASVSYENTENTGGNEAGKALLVGLLGGLLSAAGYLVYRRLPEDQKERLHSQAKTMLQQRINEIRQNFNI
jgi:LPXTG-motif cell wall-anchored protein